MNSYIQASTQLDAADALIALTEHLIDMSDFKLIMADPPEYDEELLDFVDRSDLEVLKFAMGVAERLLKPFDETRQEIIWRTALSRAA